MGILHEGMKSEWGGWEGVKSEGRKGFGVWGLLVSDA